MMRERQQKILTLPTPLAHQVLTNEGGAFNDAQLKAGLNLSRSVAINIQVPQGSEYVNLVLRIIRWSLLCVESLNLYAFEQHIYTKFAVTEKVIFVIDWHVC